MPATGKFSACRKSRKPIRQQRRFNRRSKKGQAEMRLSLQLQALPSQRPKRSSLATLKSSTFMPWLPKLICARALLPLPSRLTITPSPNFACATDSPMRHPEPLDFCAIFCAIALSEPTSGTVSQADFLLLPDQCDCTFGDSHFNDSSGSSSKKRDFML